MYIDDIDAKVDGSPGNGWRNDSGFARSMELGLRLLGVMLWLGFHINFTKSVVLPRLDGIFLGIGHDTRRMRFFLSKRRCEKLWLRLEGLHSMVAIGRRVRARAVARVVTTVVGTLWSVQVVCHRAVAMQCINF